MKWQVEDDNSAALIAMLQAKLKAQEKTIKVLINAAEQRFSTKASSMELLSQNLALERVVQQKTETLRRQEEKLKNALHDLQLTQTRLLHARKMESVGQLAAGIAHEINTPTQFIGANVQFLEEAFDDVRRLVHALERVLQTVLDDSSTDEAREAENLLKEVDWEFLDGEIPMAISQSKEGLRRISTIVQAMKEFSHPGSKVKTFHNLNKIIETTITVASNEWKYCAQIERQLAPDLPQVCCLADEIGQVILNILINAAHAIAGKNPDGKTKGTITISTHLHREHAEICIGDNGAGIPENIRERIYDPFFTTKAVGKGTGQGLAIAHNVIVKKHGGTISCVSEVDRGTVFTLRLPIESASTDSRDVEIETS